MAGNYRLYTDVRLRRPVDLPELFDVCRQQLAEPIETGILFEIPTHVAQRARDVLDVDWIAARGGLVAERAERFQVALQRHEIEPAPELDVHAGHALEREEVCDQILDRLLGQIDVRVPQQ